MFHILIENSTPNRLVGGPWSGLNGSRSDFEPSYLECNLRGGQVREALSHADVKKLFHSGNLKKDKACKACLRKMGGKLYGKAQNEEASEGVGNNNTGS